MYPYLSLVEIKVAEFYHNIDRRRWLVWLKWLIFIAFSGQFMVSLIYHWNTKCCHHLLNASVDVFADNQIEFPQWMFSRSKFLVGHPGPLNGTMKVDESKVDTIWQQNKWFGWNIQNHPIKSRFPLVLTVRLMIENIVWLKSYVEEEGSLYFGTFTDGPI